MMNTPNDHTYIFDPESSREMARLIKQDRFLTRNMGGPLVGITEDIPLHNILDLACGPGGWVLDVAYARPGAEICGVDVSRSMIDSLGSHGRSL